MKGGTCVDKIKKAHIVLKALELKSKEQDQQVGELEEEALALQRKAAAEGAAWGDIFSGLGLKQPQQEAVGEKHLPLFQKPETPDWDTLVGASKESVAQRRLDPARLTLISATHQLTADDLVYCFIIAGLALILPSVGGRHFSIQALFNHIQHLADRGQLPRLIQNIFGRTPAPWMDSPAGGMYHRYVSGHDLLTAVPKGLFVKGLVGVKQVFQHLLTDSFGLTGVPVPGSTAFLELLGRLLGHGGLEGLLKNTRLSHSDLARYTGVRALDGFVAALLTALLWGYFKWQGVPRDSLRQPKMGLLAHGLCSVGLVGLTSIPFLAPLFPFRSHINYISLLGVIKNVRRLNTMTEKMRLENKEAVLEIEQNISTLKKTTYKKGGTKS